MLNESADRDTLDLSTAERRDHMTPRGDNARGELTPEAFLRPAPLADAPAPVGEKPAPEVVKAAAAAPPQAAAPAEVPKRKGGLVKKLVLLLVVLGALAGGGWYGHRWWIDGRFLVSTDDAYIGVDMSSVTPKITGYVARVPARENQSVKAGDPLVEIDPGDYQLALDSTNAKIATQEAVIARIAAQRNAAVQQVAQADANLVAFQAAQNQAALNLQRAENLVKSGAGAQAPLDTARSAKAQADAAVIGAGAAIAAAQAAVTVFDADAKEAVAKGGELVVDRNIAARDLQFTVLRAPYDGVVGNLSVQPGDLVSPTRRLASIVPLNEVFIDANFKETQVGEITVGEKVRVEVDALPGVEVTGTVVSLAPASGSVFSLLPADNATGNFTKIVQRLPVRIAIDQTPELRERLRPGLSVTVAVDTRTAPAAGVPVTQTTATQTTAAR